MRGKRAAIDQTVGHLEHGFAGGLKARLPDNPHEMAGRTVLLGIDRASGHTRRHAVLAGVVYDERPEVGVVPLAQMSEGAGDRNRERHDQ